MRRGDSIRRLLVSVGARCPLRLLSGIDGALSYLCVGHWLSERGLTVERFEPDKWSIFRRAANEICLEMVLYLEFGVFQGESVRFWSRLLKNPASKLQGFDSFEGLPEDWSLLVRKGEFSVEGRIPRVDDPRVSFFKGWFEETLQHYVVPPHGRLFVNIDSDLYSSAKTVLRCLRPHMVTGDYVYFDEFHHREHELKAFDEFLSETKMEFRIAAADKHMEHVLFQICTP